MTDSNSEKIEKTCEGFTPGASNPKPAKFTRPTKAEKLLKLLKSKRGATIEQLQEASGWQAHSVRGFLSGTVKRKLGLTLSSDADKQGIRRYRIADSSKAAAE